MASPFKERLKAIIRNYIQTELSTQAPPSYSMGSCTQVNDDGTINVQDQNGNVWTATPKHPVVLGQNVVLANAGGGVLSAIPLGPRTPPEQIIHPPYFTGGANRIAVAQPGYVTNALPSPWNRLPLPPTPAVDIQDQGSNNVYRLQFPDLDGTWNIVSNMQWFSNQPEPATVSLFQTGGTAANATAPSGLGVYCNPVSVALSPDGTKLIVALSQINQFPWAQTLPPAQSGYSYKIRVYNIGSKLSTSVTTPIYAGTNYNIWPIDATLDLDYTVLSYGVCSVLAPVTPNQEWERVYEVIFPMFVSFTSDGSPIWMDMYKILNTHIVAFLPESFPGPSNYPFDYTAGELYESNSGLGYTMGFIRNTTGVQSVVLFQIGQGYPSQTSSPMIQFIPLALIENSKNADGDIIARLFGILPVAQGLTDSGNLNVSTSSAQFGIADTQSPPAYQTYSYPGPISAIILTQNPLNVALLDANTFFVQTSSIILPQSPFLFNSQYSSATFQIPAYGGSYIFDTFVQDRSTFKIEEYTSTLPASLQTLFNTNSCQFAIVFSTSGTPYLRVLYIDTTTFDYFCAMYQGSINTNNNVITWNNSPTPGLSPGFTPTTTFIPTTYDPNHGALTAELPCGVTILKSK